MQAERRSGPATKKLATLSLLSALAILMGYVESLLPLNFGVPGIKPGFGNIVVLIVLLLYSWREALAVSAVRVLVIGFLFGNAFSIVYSLAGTGLSIAVMALLLRAGRFGMLGVSAAGGVAHNVGQLLVAKLVLPALPLLWYTPVLILAGLAAGLAVGLITHLVATRLPVLYWQRRNPE